MFRNAFQTGMAFQLGSHFLKQKTYLDEFLNMLGLHIGYKQKYTAATAITVAVGDTGTHYVLNSSGACALTLPAPAQGLAISFVQLADQNTVITGSNNIVSVGDVAASTITFSTASQKIGASGALVAIDTDGAGTYKWEFRKTCSNTAVVA